MTKHTGGEQRFYGHHIRSIAGIYGTVCKTIQKDPVVAASTGDVEIMKQFGREDGIIPLASVDPAAAHAPVDGDGVVSVAPVDMERVPGGRGIGADEPEAVIARAKRNIEGIAASRSGTHIHAVIAIARVNIHHARHGEDGVIAAVAAHPRAVDIEDDVPPVASFQRRATRAFRDKPAMLVVYPDEFLRGVLED